MALTDEPASEASPMPTAWPVPVGVLVPVALSETEFAFTVVPSPMWASTDPLAFDSTSSSVTETPRLPESPVASPSGFSSSVAVSERSPLSSMSLPVPIDVWTACVTVACAEAPPPPAMPPMPMKCAFATGASVWLFAVIVRESAFTVALLPTVACVPPPRTAVAVRMSIARPRPPVADAGVGVGGVVRVRGDVDRAAGQLDVGAAADGGADDRIAGDLGVGGQVGEGAEAAEVERRRGRGRRVRAVRVRR